MHELSVTESILEIAQRHAQEAGAQRLTALHLVIGQLASIVDDSVQFYWDIISKGTIAEGARLHFKRIPTQMKCLSCAKEFQPNGYDLACPECHSLQIKIIQGEEFYLEAIEIDG